jgi:hypothetical protein
VNTELLPARRLAHRLGLEWRHRIPLLPRAAQACGILSSCADARLGHAREDACAPRRDARRHTGGTAAGVEQRTAGGHGSASPPPLQRLMGRVCRKGDVRCAELERHRQCARRTRASEHRRQRDEAVECSTEQVRRLRACWRLRRHVHGRHRAVVRAGAKDCIGQAGASVPAVLGRRVRQMQAQSSRGAQQRRSKRVRRVGQRGLAVIVEERRQIRAQEVCARRRRPDKELGRAVQAD